MSLSIIICVYNTPINMLDECLRSVYSEVGHEQFEIVLVDDGSSTDYSEIISKYPVQTGAEVTAVRYFVIFHGILRNDLGVIRT